MSQSQNLAPYKGMYYEEIYDKGEKETQFEIRAPSSPYLLLILNENSGRDYSLIHREDRGRSTSVIPIDRWDGGVKFTKMIVEKNWLGVALISISNQEDSVTFKMSRKFRLKSGVRSDVFNVVSLILYGLMVTAIALLIILSICVACVKGIIF